VSTGFWKTHRHRDDRKLAPMGCSASVPASNPTVDGQSTSPHGGDSSSPMKIDTSASGGLLSASISPKTARGSTLLVRKGNDGRLQLSWRIAGDKRAGDGDWIGAFEGPADVADDVSNGAVAGAPPSSRELFRLRCIGMCPASSLWLRDHSAVSTFNCSPLNSCTILMLPLINAYVLFFN